MNRRALRQRHIEYTRTTSKPTITFNVWKAEKVSEVKFETNCQVEKGSGVGGKYTFKWSTTLDGGEFENLLKGKEITLSADIELRADGNWETLNGLKGNEGELFMGVYWDKSKGSLDVYVDDKKIVRDGSMVTDLLWSQKAKFVCRDAGLKSKRALRAGMGNGEFIFNGEVYKNGNMRLTSVENSVKILTSLKGCDYQHSNKTTATDNYQ